MSHQSPFNLNEIIIGNVVDTEENHRNSALCRTQIQFIFQIVSSTLCKALHLLPEKGGRWGWDKIFKLKKFTNHQHAINGKMHHHFMFQKEEKENKALPSIMGCHCDDDKMHADLRDALEWTLVILESMKYDRHQL